MTSTVTRPEASSAPARKVRGQRGRRVRPRQRSVGQVVWRVLLGALAVVVLATVWFAGGLLWASHTVQSQAEVAQSELQQFSDTLQAGDEVAAKKHLEAGEAALNRAKGAAGWRQVRIAGDLPYVGDTIADLDHLLAAAGIMTRSGRDAMTVYEKFSGENSQLFSNGRFSIPAIKEAQRSVAHIRTSMDRAEMQLQLVRGDGPRGAQALEKKQSALKQITSLRAELASLSPLLDAMPAAVGADGKRTYLVAIMNPAEMRASGGAPLSVAFVRFKDGKMSIPLKGSTSALTDINAEYYWNRLTGKKDPFQLPAGEAQRFVNTTFNPSFAVSGEQMVRATPANFGIKTDGVIALDITAIGHLLDVTGPIKTDFYGSITGKNIADKLLVKGYENTSDPATVVARHDVNDALMTTMLSRLTEGGGLIGKMQALGQAIPGRHLQMYFRDDALEKVMVAKGMAGIIPVTRSGNLTAVYTQNGNGNKLDVYQRRTVREVVRLRADGSAVVTRTVALQSPTPPYTAPFPERFRGYDTRYATNLVINLMPKGAEVLEQPEVVLTSTVADGVDQDGHTYAQAAVMIPPDGSASLTWKYRVPHAAVVQGDRMTFRDDVVPQAMLRPPTLDLTVRAPKGWTAATAPGWTATSNGVTTQVPMDKTQVLQVLLSR